MGTQSLFSVMPTSCDVQRRTTEVDLVSCMHGKINPIGTHGCLHSTVVHFQRRLPLRSLQFTSDLTKPQSVRRRTGNDDELTAP